MTQQWTDDVFASSHNAQTDLQNMENNFQTLKSLFSGSSAPANTVAGIPWFDTGKDLLRLRNAANGSWYGVMHADASQQIWVYRNDAMSGWVVVTSVTDKVLAIKGGSNDYNVTGGNTSGSWSITGLSHSHPVSVSSHNHQTCSYNSGNYSGNLYDSGGNQISPNTTSTGFENSWVWGTADTNTDQYKLAEDAYTSNTAPSASSDTAAPSTSNWRPAAAVGTLQRMDV
jgi:hypothetical protein